MKTYKANCEDGVFRYERIVVVDRGLRYHPYAQCGVTWSHDGKTELFVSYETIVCEINTDGWFHLNGEWSTTTSKQIGWFLYEWCVDHSHRRDLCNYRYVRDLYRKGLDVNLYNGDTRPSVNGVVQTIGIKH